MTRCAFFIPPILFLILPTVGFSEVPIPSACRIANRPPGRCGWCALETLGRYLCIKTLYGLVEKHPTQSRPRELEKVLTENAVKYHSQSRWCRSTAILQEAVRDNLGAVIGFRPAYSGGGGHIVTLVDFGTKEVRILDPNDADRHVRTMDLDTFLDRWDGYALVLDRP